LFFFEAFFYLSSTCWKPSDRRSIIRQKKSKYKINFGYLLLPAEISKRQRIIPNMKTINKQPPPIANSRCAFSKPDKRR
jgi:hypothetical protein